MYLNYVFKLCFYAQELTYSIFIGYLTKKLNLFFIKYFVGTFGTIIAS